METEVLIALIGKMVDERLACLPSNSGNRGPRGFPGHDGQDGKDFSFTEHEGTIREWAKEFALSFEDLSAEQIEALRGPRGRDGASGVDGHSFVYEENRDAITQTIRGVLDELQPKLKLRFSDLTEEEIGQLRGARGRDGRDGRDFIFDDHLDYFNSLRLKFSDLTDAEKDSLKLHFSQLTEEEKALLKLRFEDLTDDDKISLRGPRGLRGQRGSHGRDGKDGLSIRGLPGPQGIRGLPGTQGVDGVDGADGADAPFITDIRLEENGNEINFVFEFSDGSVISTDRVELPQPVQYLMSAGGGAGSGRNKVDYETIVDEPSADTTYVGYALPGSATSGAVWKIKRLQVVGSETIIEYAGSNAHFDKVWDDRASLSYG